MKYFTMFFLVMMTISFSGCSTKDIASSFNEKDIKIKLVHSESNNDYQSYEMEVTNTGKFEIGYLNFYLYYPVILSYIPVSTYLEALFVSK